MSAIPTRLPGDMRVISGKSVVSGVGTSVLVGAGFTASGTETHAAATVPKVVKALNFKKSLLFNSFTVYFQPKTSFPPDSIYYSKSES